MASQAGIELQGLGGVESMFNDLRDFINNRGIHFTNTKRMLINYARNERERAFSSKKGTDNKLWRGADLQDTGTLRASVTEIVWRRKKDGAVALAHMIDRKTTKRGQLFAIVGNALGHGRVDQRSKPGGRGGPMIARKFFGLSASSRRQIAAEFGGRINKIAKKRRKK